MQIRRVNLESDAVQDQILPYLTSDFNAKSKMKDLIAGFAFSHKTHSTKAYDNNTLLKEVINITDAHNAWSLFLNMSLGITHASYYLAVSFLQGYGVNKNEELKNLCLAIASKLQDTQTLEFIKNTDIPAKSLKVADKCITVMHEAYNAIKDREITYEEAIGWGKYFDKLVKLETQESFEDNILDSVFKNLGAPFIEVLDTPIITEDMTYNNSEITNPLGTVHEPEITTSCCTIL